MSDYIKTFATTCHGEVLEAINADAGITPECVQIIDTDDGNMTFQFDVALSGGEETTLDGILSAWSCPTIVTNEQVESFVDEQVFDVDESKTITLSLPLGSNVVHVSDPNVEVLINSTLLSPKGTGWDPGNKSTGEANINNGSYSDLVYNNLAAGNTSGIIFGIDMGSVTTINAMKRWDYNVTYYDTSWEFIGTNDATGATYDVIFSQTQKSANLNPNPFFKAFSDQTYRYFGCRCVTSNNASYTIISELEFYSGTLATVEKKLSNSVDYEYSIISSTQIEVKNISGFQRTFKTLILGT